MKTTLTLVAMLVIAPLVAAAILVGWQPDRWGGSVNPLATIAGMAFFGVFTVPLWPTYLPSLIIIPLVMKRVAASRAFVRLPILILSVLSLVVGALAGSCVIVPIAFLMASNDSTGSDLFGNFLAAGAVSGAVTLTLISLIHRLVGPDAGQYSSRNVGPATPPPIPTATEGGHR